MSQDVVAAVTIAVGESQANVIKEKERIGHEKNDKVMG
jgi:hypothetical protein